MSEIQEPVKIVGFCRICECPLTTCDCDICENGGGPGLAHAELPEGFEGNQHLAEL